MPAPVTSTTSVSPVAPSTIAVRSPRGRTAAPERPEFQFVFRVTFLIWMSVSSDANTLAATVTRRNDLGSNVKDTDRPAPESIACTWNVSALLPSTVTVPSYGGKMRSSLNVDRFLTRISESSSVSCAVGISRRTLLDTMVVRPLKSGMHTRRDWLRNSAWTASAIARAPPATAGMKIGMRSVPGTKAIGTMAATSSWPESCEFGLGMPV